MIDHDQRAQELKAAQSALTTFLRSPNGRHSPEYLKVMLNLDSLFDPDSATQTAYNLGAYAVIQHLYNLMGDSQ